MKNPTLKSRGKKKKKEKLSGIVLKKKIINELEQLRSVNLRDGINQINRRVEMIIKGHAPAMGQEYKTVRLQ